MIALLNGLLFDGSGNTPKPGNVLVDGNRIADVDAPSYPSDAEIVDCTGLAIAPGFIDLHSHADLQVLEDRSWVIAPQGLLSRAPFSENGPRMRFISPHSVI